MSSDQAITLAIAIYGAVLSTILAYRQIKRDRRRILVFLEYAHFLNRAQITITNIGYRPIMIRAISMSTWIAQGGNAGWQPVPTNLLFEPEFLTEYPEPLPATLNDGEHLTLPLTRAVSSILISNKMKAQIRVHDSQGKEYRGYRTRMLNPPWEQY
jgi:hypothetical protein